MNLFEGSHSFLTSVLNVKVDEIQTDASERWW